MSELRQFALAAYFLQLSRIVRQVVFVYCEYRSFFPKVQSVWVLSRMVGEWGQAPILDKSESFVSVAVLKVFQRDIWRFERFCLLLG